MEFLAKKWWVFLVRGIIAVLFGIAALVWPGQAVIALAILFGIYAIVDGFFAIASSIVAAGFRVGWVWLLLEGVVDIILGALVLALPQISVAAAGSLIAIWAIVTGVMEVVDAIRLRKMIEGELWWILTGILSIVLGILLLVWPSLAALTLIIIVGIYALFIGVLLILLSFRLRSLRPQE